MTDPNRNNLLKEVFQADNLEEFRSASLDVALRAVGKRRRRRRLAQMTGAALTLLMVSSLTWLAWPSKPSTVSQTTREPSTESHPNDSGVKIISEQELFALFPNRSVALVGSPGQQKLIFLDQPDPRQNSN